MVEELNLPKKRIIKADASIWKRVLAFIADFLIIRIIIFSPFGSAIEKRMPVLESFDAYFQFIQSNQELINSFAPMMFGMMFLVFAYFAIFEWKLQQTPGQMILKLKLVPEKNTNLNFWKIIVRNLFAVPLGPLIILWVVEPVYLLITKKRLTEIITKTKTIEEIVV